MLKTAKNHGGLFKNKVFDTSSPTPFRERFGMHFYTIFDPKIAPKSTPGAVLGRLWGVLGRLGPTLERLGPS